MLKESLNVPFIYVTPTRFKFWRKSIFSNGVTGKKCRAFFPASGVLAPIERGLEKIGV